MPSTIYPSVERLAVDALRTWLAKSLPAVLLQVNSERTAVLTAPLPGPYEFPAGATLAVGGTRAGNDVFVALTTGSRTSTQVATEINAVASGYVTAGVDGYDRLTISALAAPSTLAASVVGVGPDNTATSQEDATGANVALGWDVGGESAVNTLIVAPTLKAIMDGEPLSIDPSVIAPGGLLVFFGKRSAQPVAQDTRTDMHRVNIDLAIFRAEPAQQTHRNREPIQAALRAVRACFLTDAGRYGGFVATSSQAICKVIERGSSVGPSPVALVGSNVPNASMDLAELLLSVIVYERPTAS